MYCSSDRKQAEEHVDLVAAPRQQLADLLCAFCSSGEAKTHFFSSCHWETSVVIDDYDLTMEAAQKAGGEALNWRERVVHSREWL